MELANAHGVATECWDWQAQHGRMKSRPSPAVLTALGVDSDGDEQVERALTEVDLAPWRRTLPATVVAREGWTPWVFAHVPAGPRPPPTVHPQGGPARAGPPGGRGVPAPAARGGAGCGAPLELPRGPAARGDPHAR